MKLLVAGWLAAALSPCGEQSNRLAIRFQPESDRFVEAAREYEVLWTREGARITAAMEAASGLKFEDREVRAIVREAASYSGHKETPMVLRASYPLDPKKATLIHELGHRLQSDLFQRGEDEHKYLFLWIYDVWGSLYGREFADAQVAVEKERGRMYPSAWGFALSFTPKQRAAKWKETVTARTPH